MKNHHSQQELDEMRLAFDGSHGVGLISNIVLSEYEKDKVTTVKHQELVNFFSTAGFLGVVELLKTFPFLDNSKNYEFGSHAIDLYDVASGPFSIENAMTMVCLKIGNKRNGISPSSWMLYLMRGFDRLSPIQKIGFDGVCTDFAKMNQAITSGNYEEVELKDVLEP